MPIWDGLIVLLFSVLVSAYFICRYYESGAAQEYMAELRRMWKSLGIPGRIVLGVLIVFLADVGGSKGTPPMQSLFRQLFWHANDIWALRTATDALTGSASASSNAVASADAATNTMAETAATVATQKIWTVEFDWPMEDRTPPHDEQNVMAYQPWRSNVWINGVLHHDHFIRFNAMVSTNPAIISIAYNGFDQTTGDRVRILADVITNSYPKTVLINRPSGVNTCYMFRCAVPESITNSVIGWDSEVVFGAPEGSNRGFNIAGIFVVSRDGQLWIGRSYTNYVYGLTNVYINGLKSEAPE